jgi:PTS system N-acetylglucosamine-specific IIC component
VETIVHGDLHRFFAGDPTAGAFMAGFFPIMMFGLPAACLAMIHTADTKRKKATAGILLSMAFTSFLTGITEPVEFAFMFLAFPLYVVHAFLTGISMALMHILHVKLGFTFSAGLFDYLLSYGLGTNAWMLLPVGLAYGVIYYFVFRFAIVKWNLKTPGREDEPQEVTPASAQTVAPVETVAKEQAPAAKQVEPAPNEQTTPKADSRAAKYVAALGGKENLKVVDACATRLRLEVSDPSVVQDATLKQLGARGVVRVGANSVQVVIGPEADLISTEIKDFIK